MVGKRGGPVKATEGRKGQQQEARTQDMGKIANVKNTTSLQRLLN